MYFSRSLTLMNTARLSFYTCLCLLCFITVSCRSTKPGQGLSILQQDTDTVAIRQRIATIKGISNDVFEPHSFQGAAGIPLQYRLLRPSPTDQSRQYPLIIVFHGSGASGADNEKQLGLLAKLWATPPIREKYPAYIVVPQFPARSSNYTMDSNRHVLASVPQPALQSALQLVDSLRKALNADNSRIYVVGFSMGASTAINAMTYRPGLFAAGVSISGIPQFEKVNELAGIPLWLIHGNSDTENPIDSDKLFFKEVNSKGQTRFWIYENTNHNDIFSNTLLGEDIPAWLFNKHK
ncbi:MAG: alpha/beta fold hydrolase [Chitinophagaceae bacterium]